MSRRSGSRSGSPCPGDVIVSVSTGEHGGNVEEQLPALPPVNDSCYTAPPIPADDNQEKQCELPTEEQVVETKDDDLKTVVINKNNYTQYNKTINIIVNRNHVHTLRVVTNENNYNTYCTNKVYKVNDIHHQCIEHLQGEAKTINDCKESVTIEPARCILADDIHRHGESRFRVDCPQSAASASRYLRAADVHRHRVDDLAAGTTRVETTFASNRSLRSSRW